MSDDGESKVRSSRRSKRPRPSYSQYADDGASDESDEDNKYPYNGPCSSPPPSHHDVDTYNVDNSDNSDNLDKLDNSEAIERLDDIVNAGEISLVTNKYLRNKSKVNKDPLTVTAVRYLDKDKIKPGEIFFTCVVCLEKFKTMRELSRHELFEHFVWAYKPLLMELLDIIDDENFYCPNSSCSLRLRLLKCINGHQNNCPECPFASDNGNSLVEHYKVTHVGRTKNNQMKQSPDNGIKNDDWDDDGWDMKPLQEIDKDDHSYGSTKVNKEKVKEKAKEKIMQEPQPVLCVECGDMFHDQSRLDKHILVKHTKSLMCEKCGFGTGCKDELSKHLVHWHADMCEDCGLPIDAIEVEGGKMGKYWSKATGHMCPAQLGPGNLGTLKGKFGTTKKIQRVPNGFGCTMCGFTSRLSHIVHRHLSVMHGSLLCPVEGCERILENRPNLLGHLKQFHPEKCHLCLYQEGVDTDKHDCVSRLLLPGPNDVGCQYSTNPMILNIVGGGRPVGCHLCGELFPQQNKLRVHTNTCHSISTTVQT